MSVVLVVKGGANLVSGARALYSPLPMIRFRVFLFLMPRWQCC